MTGLSVCKPLGYPRKILRSGDGVIKGYFVLTEQVFLKKNNHVVSVNKVIKIFFWGVSLMLVTSKLSNDGVYSQHVFGVPFLNFRIVEFVKMLPRECWSFYTDCFACYFSAKCRRLQLF